MKETTILHVINWATDYLRSKGLATPRLDAELLLSHLLNTDRVGLYVNYKETLDETRLIEFKELLDRRALKEPISYILGYKEFWSIRFKVDRRVFIPRPETELLVEEVVKIVRKEYNSKKVNILDIGTGAGTIAISLAKEIGDVRIFATDISRDAVELASENAREQSIYSKIIFGVGDLFSPFKIRGLFDLVVSNPPYIPTHELNDLQDDIKNYEPKQALDGGEEGLSFIKRIINEAPLYLKDSGWLLIEIGYNQAGKIEEIFNRSGYFYSPEIIKDYRGFNRVVKAKKRWRD